MIDNGNLRIRFTRQFFVFLVSFPISLTVDSNLAAVPVKLRLVECLILTKKCIGLVCYYLRGVEKFLATIR